MTPDRRRLAVVLGRIGRDHGGRVFYLLGICDALARRTG
jgi:hypothetical protein